MLTPLDLSLLLLVLALAGYAVTVWKKNKPPPEPNENDEPDVRYKRQCREYEEALQDQRRQVSDVTARLRESYDREAHLREELTRVYEQLGLNTLSSSRQSKASNVKEFRKKTGN